MAKKGKRKYSKEIRLFIYVVLAMVVMLVGWWRVYVNMGGGVYQWTDWGAFLLTGIAFFVLPYFYFLWLAFPIGLLTWFALFYFIGEKTSLLSL
jgi:hypothetical protein